MTEDWLHKAVPDTGRTGESRIERIELVKPGRKRTKYDSRLVSASLSLSRGR